jgi:hypothetical protein
MQKHVYSTDRIHIMPQDAIQMLEHQKISAFATAAYKLKDCFP